MAKSDNTAVAVAAQKYLKYYPKTGIFAWIAGKRSGRVAGRQTTNGYWYIKFRYLEFPAHRLAWFFEHKEWPDGEIDHINGDKLDNRISNLRPASRSENSWNAGRSAKNTSGEKNVYWLKRQGKWAVTFMMRGKVHRVGLFAEDEFDKAVLAARAARERLQKEFCRHS